MQARTCVIGGGLSGLVVGVACGRAGQHVTLFEAEARLGGQIHTERAPLDGAELVLEHGAEGFVASSAATEALATALDIAGDLVSQSSNLSFAFDGHTVRELEAGEAARLLGFQVPQSELGRGIRSFRLGSGQLTDALVPQLRRVAQIELQTPVSAVHAQEEGLLVTAHGIQRHFDHVVVATQARPAGRLLTSLLGKDVEALLQAPTASSVNVSLVYRKDSLPALSGTGFIVTGAGPWHGFRACSYASLKLPGRAPDGYVVLRAFFRPTAQDLVEHTDAAWLRLAEQHIQAALHFKAEPLLSRVARWQDALPVHSPAFRERVDALASRLTPQGVHLVGSAFYGSGIDAALRSANVVITRLCGSNPLFAVS